MLFTQKSEFGIFELREEAPFFNLYLYSTEKEIQVGFIRTLLGSYDNDILITELMSKFVETYLKVLRAEAKFQKFIDIPLSNEFKDAFLRMRIEDSGQTLEVRKFIDDYDSNHNWITYAEYAENFNLLELMDTHDFGFITPYSRYHYVRLGDKLGQLHKIKASADSLLADVNVPYTETPDNILGAMYRHSMKIIDIDTEDMINRKFVEISKRTAEAIKYMFGMDKLRRAVRNRGLS